MKKIFSLLSCVCVVAVLLSPMSLVFAQDAPKPPRTDYDAGPVTAVDVANSMIDVQTGKQTIHKFKVTEDTKVQLEDKEITLQDVAVGKYVKISYVRDGNNRVAKKITVLSETPVVIDIQYPQGNVTAVNVEARTLEVQTGKETKKTYIVAEDAKVLKGVAAKGAPPEACALADIKVGNFVRMSVTKDGDKLIAKRVSVFDKEPEKASATIGAKVGVEENEEAPPVKKDEKK